MQHLKTMTQEELLEYKRQQKRMSSKRKHEKNFQSMTEEQRAKYLERKQHLEMLAAMSKEEKRNY